MMPVLSENSAAASRRSIVITKQPAEPRVAADRSVRGSRWCRHDQAVVQALVIPFRVIVLGEFPQRPPQMRLPEDDQPIQAFFLDGSDKSSSAGESHPRALSEPYVKLALHTA